LNDLVRQILDLARWAPSGDNTQPWRFEVIGKDHVVVHGFDTREHCVYDIEGHSSQLAIGALLENICLAATAHGQQVEISRRLSAPETRPTFDVRLAPDSRVNASPLIPFIQTRSVQRRALSTRPLTAAEKHQLGSSVSSAYSVLWLEAWSSRVRAALLMFANGKLRLTMPEAYAVHREIIEWQAQFSEERVPDRALGLDPLTLKLMRPLMKSWRRVSFFNSYLAGTLLPRIQLDLIPSLACAGHLAIVAKAPPSTVDDFVSAGRAMQRFWLTATQLGLWMQPEMTPLIFSGYVRSRKAFSSVAASVEHARHLAARLDDLIGKDAAAAAVFMARIGAGAAPRARSLRRPLDKLLIAAPAESSTHSAITRGATPV
jgi:hypothetical protein